MGQRVGKSGNDVALCLNETTPLSSLQYCPFLLKHSEDILVLASSSVVREEEKRKPLLEILHVYGSGPITSSYLLQEALFPRRSQGYFPWLTSFGSLGAAPQPSSGSNHSCSGQFIVSADSCYSDGATSSMGRVILLPGLGSSLIGGNWLTPLKSVSWNLGELMFWGQPSTSGEQEP